MKPDEKAPEQCTALRWVKLTVGSRRASTCFSVSSSVLTRWCDTKRYRSESQRLRTELRQRNRSRSKLTCCHACAFINYRSDFGIAKDPHPTSLPQTLWPISWKQLASCRTWAGPQQHKHCMLLTVGWLFEWVCFTFRLPRLLCDELVALWSVILWLEKPFQLFKGMSLHCTLSMHLQGVENSLNVESPLNSFVLKLPFDMHRKVHIKLDFQVENQPWALYIGRTALVLISQYPNQQMSKLKIFCNWGVGGGGERG